MVLWGETEAAYDAEAGLHAALSYDCVAAAGPAARPLEFPTPTVNRGARCDVAALDHRTGRLHPIKNVLMRVSTHSGSPVQPQRAYLIKKTISKSVYGVIRICVVLKRRDVQPVQTDATVRRRRSNGMIRDEDTEWESTEELAVVKVRSARGWFVGSSDTVGTGLGVNQNVTECIRNISP